jgi:hypothetical protein
LRTAQPQGQRGEAIYKVAFAAVIVGGLIAAPLPALSQSPPAPAAAPAAPAEPAEPAKTEAKTDAKKETKKPSGGVAAMRARQTKCAAEWKETKADSKGEKGMKWPQFWSACNKHLKAAG